MNESAQPHRRWFQYSLRTLLVAVTVCCIWLGVQANRARQQREAISAIKELGGVTGFSYEYDAANIWIEDAEPPGPRWLRKLVGDDYFATLVFVNDCGTEGANDATLERLRGQTGLTCISLQAENRVTDAGLKHLSGLTALEHLDISGCRRLTDGGLMHLQHLTILQTLHLNAPTVTEAGITFLQQSLPNCRIFRHGNLAAK